MPNLPSFVSMLQAAAPVVQAVMGCLILASLAVWSILAAKLAELHRARSGLTGSLDALTGAATLAEARLACPAHGLAAAMLEIAGHEVMRSSGPSALNADGVKERLALRLARAEAQAVRRWQHGLGMLGTIGATAPFIGLFGTVWGIMNSFTGIAQQHASSLAAVAPGIAEALMATATGLIAAIPAVIAYNILNRLLGGHRLLAGDLAAAVRCLVSLDLERHAPSRPLRSVTE